MSKTLVDEEQYQLHGREVSEAEWQEHEDLDDHCAQCAQVGNCWCLDCFPTPVGIRRRATSAG